MDESNTFKQPETEREPWEPLRQLFADTPLDVFCTPLFPFTLLQWMVETFSSWGVCMNSFTAKEKIQLAKQKMSKCPHPGTSSASYRKGHCCLCTWVAWQQAPQVHIPLWQCHSFFFLCCSSAKTFLKFQIDAPVVAFQLKELEHLEGASHYSYEHSE